MCLGIMAKPRPLPRGLPDLIASVPGFLHATKGSRLYLKTHGCGTPMRCELNYPAMNGVKLILGVS
jgi:hypothetical protein